MTLDDSAWLATLAGIGVGLVLVILSTASRRPWLALPAVVPVAAAITLGAIGVTPPQNSLFVPALGMGMVALGTLGGNPLVAFILSTAIREAGARGQHGGMLVPDDEDEDPKPRKKGKDREVLRGGTTIGYLERFAAIGSVLLGQPAAIAIVVAIKGLGRFRELDSSAVRERFIIGTLVSLAWAGACSAGLTLAW